MLLDPGLKKFKPACNAPPNAKCAPYYRSLQYANSFLIVLTGILLVVVLTTGI